MLDCSLSPQDGLLFLPEPFNFLLDSSQLLLLLFCFVFLDFFVAIVNLDLLELHVSLSNLY
jgi:hypothetical protein